MLLTLPQVGAAADQAGGADNASGAGIADSARIADGEYASLPYRYLKDGTNTASAADAFMQVAGSGRLVVSNGTATFYHRIPAASAGWIPYLAYRQAGQPKAVIVNEAVSNNEGYAPFGRSAADATTGEVEVSAVLEYGADSIDVLMHVVIPELSYNHWYNAQLTIDTSGLPRDTGGGPGGEPGSEPGGGSTGESLERLNASIATAQALYDGAVAGDGYGQYPAEAKTLFGSRIEEAKAAAAGAGANPDGIVPAWETLNAAIEAFKASVKSANKTELVQAMADVQALYDKVQAQGELGAADSAARAALNGDAEPGNDVETYVIPAVTAGEFAQGTAAALKSALNSAQAVLDNVAATDAKVAALVKSLKNKKLLYENYEYRLEPGALPIYVLDNGDHAAEQSAYASDFAGIAYRLTNGSDATAYANVPMKNANVRQALQSVPLVSGDYELPQEGAADGYKAVRLVSFNGLNQPVYQLRSQSAGNPAAYSGLSYFSYQVGSETRKVYISYNYNELKSLRDNVEAAQSLYRKAGNSDDYAQDEQALAALGEAIGAAKQVGDNLAARRPAITAASAALKAAVASFRQSAAYKSRFTAAAAEADDFSAAGAYLGPKADIAAAEGAVYAEITVLKSSEVAVRVISGDSVVDAPTVGEDKQANTRRVKLKIPDLAALTPVQITASGTTYEVRLNFNDVDNSALAAKVAEARAELASAKIGTGAGQHPESAKAALEQVIAAAAAEAARIEGTQAITDAAVARLGEAIKTFRASVNPSSGGGGGGGGSGTAELADGKYKINFTIQKNGTSQASVMNEYAAHPGRLLVENGSMYVYIWLKQSKEITDFTVEGSSTEIVSSDSSGNTRWVRFPVSDLKTKLSGWVKVDWPEINYFHEYDVQIQLGSYSKVSDWGGEVFGAVRDRPNPDAPGSGPGEGEKEEGAVGGSGGSGGASAGGSAGGTGAAGAEFADTANHWAAAAISRAVGLGIVNGYADGSFRPNAAISRVEFAVMLSRALSLPSAGGELVFADKDAIGGWAQPFIKQAVSAGVVSGFQDGTFRPDRKISRAELTVMIVRALGLTLEKQGSLPFADAAQIPAYAIPYAAAAAKYGLIEGVDGNRFGADAPATRAEAITLVLRAVDYAAKKTSGLTGGEASSAS